VLVADPGRAYLPRENLTEIARCDVPTSLELEDQPLRQTVLYSLGHKNTVG
jgi:predicted nicotinamide N-methyase